jgi:hypothetical protein
VRHTLTTFFFFPFSADGLALVFSTGPKKTPSTCSTQVPTYGQCGGISGPGCGSPTGQACSDAPWPTACCGAGSSCNRLNEWYWQCQRDADCGKNGQKNAAGQTLVADWGQCGGQSACPAGTDCGGGGPWPSVVCCPGAVCKDVGAEWYSQCVPP